VSLIMDIYRDFGFDNVRIKLSTRPENRIGSDETWDKLEKALAQALDHMQMPYALFPGEGAFYGPKLEFVLRDAIGRDWQCGTLQVDMNLPERFDASYVAADNSRQRPVMLHRALFGSLERFTGILIEHFAGALPVWLAPVQVCIMNISESQADYGQNVAQTLQKQGFRVESDLRGEKITYKIRDRSLQKIPYLIVVGDKEKESGMVAVRARGGKDLGVMSLEALAELLRSDIDSKH
ncbi:MAG: His/Gly/Thr/Pro-type tRNA ligase C-terminal domain-containing protein, partial [Burkholderiaceae bacterium]